MQDKDWNLIAGLEKAIAEKYGQEATINPKSLWTQEKEQNYLEQLKEFEIKDKKIQQGKEKVEIDGVLIPKKLVNDKTSHTCVNCKKYSFSRDDDIYLTKYKTCYKCYAIEVEGREERWLNGEKYNGK
jgi:hypothetical protein